MHAIKVTKPDHIRHIFSKQKIKVIDAYQSSKDMTCQLCKSVNRPTILIIDSDLASVSSYQVSECQSCLKQSWYVVIK